MDDILSELKNAKDREARLVETASRRERTLAFFRRSTALLTITTLALAALTTLQNCQRLISCARIESRSTTR
jgi:hypothetical protein